MKKHNFLMSLILVIVAALAAPFKWYWKNAVASQLFVKTYKAQARNKMLPTLDAEITVTNGAAGATAGTDTVAIQFKGPNGEDATERFTVMWYLSNDAYGNSISATSTDVTANAIGTDGLLIELSANVAGFMTSESDGDVDLALTIPSGKTVYLVLVMPDGRLVVSDAITYTAS